MERVLGIGGYFLRSADPTALAASYRDDLVNSGGQGLGQTAVIDQRTDLDLLGFGNDIHTTDWSYVMRARMTKAGTVANQVIGTGFATTPFPNVSNIGVLFGATNQTVTFDSSAFSFTTGVTISSSGAGTNDSVIKAGANTLTITGTSNYLGGTTISAGTLQIGNGGGTGSIAGNVIDNASLHS